MRLREEKETVIKPDGNTEFWTNERNPTANASVEDEQEEKREKKKITTSQDTTCELGYVFFFSELITINRLP